MMLLHLSDIHFRSPNCENPAQDPDRPFRTRLIQDARAQATALGSVDAILISGDIAFRGVSREYAVAKDWIRDLAEACGCCYPEGVFVVPGNHDVDRSVITGSAATRNAQNAISRSPLDRREEELRIQLSDPNTGPALLAPLAAYNEFAKAFNCQVFYPERLYWTHDLSLEHGVHLRINGLTSILLSGLNGQNDAPAANLYLSPLQTVFDPVDDVINLVISHHPPDWLTDNDDVDAVVCARSAIHLFGHRHRQRVTRERNYFRFYAGAVNPDRNEQGWCPGYNLIRLEVTGEGPERALKIEAHIREWQTDPEQFRAKKAEDEDEVYRHTIAMPGRGPAAAAVPGINVVTADPDVRAEVGDDKEEVMVDDKTRNLVFRFWNLTVSQRRQIALRLELIEADEMQLPEPERYGRALLRAGERNQLDALADEIAKVED